MYLVQNEAKPFAGEAFVFFSHINEIEFALEQVPNKKIQNLPIKVNRSSENQFRNLCESLTTQKVGGSDIDVQNSGIKDLKYVFV